MRSLCCHVRPGFILLGVAAAVVGLQELDNRRMDRSGHGFPLLAGAGQSQSEPKSNLPGPGAHDLGCSVSAVPELGLLDLAWAE